MTNKPNIFARGYRAMVDSFNYVATQAEGAGDLNQQPAEIDDMKISYSDAKTLYLANPMARKLVDKPIEYAMSKRPIVEMPGCPDDLIDEVWREWDRLRLDQVIATAQRNKKIYGASAIAMGIEGIPASYPATAQVLRSNDVWFNAVDALQMAGNIFDLDANSKNYGRLKTFRLNGQVYPKGRYHFESNGEMVYLSFEGSNFNFAGRSAFRAIRTPLDAYKASFKAFKRIATLTGVLVHAAENSGANMGLSQKVRGQNILSLKGLDQESVISVNQKDTITNLQFQYVNEAMQARMAIIQDIASGAGIPAQLLLEDSFAEALGSGNEDYRAVIQWLETYQSQEIELWYRWLMPVILTRVCTERRYAEYQAAEPELSGTLHSEALQQWRDEMKFKWPKLIPQTDEELQDSKAKKLESIGIVFANTKDAQWYADEVNALELFANEVQEFEYVEPELPAFGGGDEPAPQIRADAAFEESKHPRGDDGKFGSGGGGGENKSGEVISFKIATQSGDVVSRSLTKGDWVQPPGKIAKAGPIEGVSLAEKKVKVGGSWYDVMTVDPVSTPEKIPAKKEAMSKVIRQNNRKTGGDIEWGDDDRVM